MLNKNTLQGIMHEPDEQELSKLNDSLYKFYKSHWSAWKFYGASFFVGAVLVYLACLINYLLPMYGPEDDTGAVSMATILVMLGLIFLLIHYRSYKTSVFARNIKNGSVKVTKCYKNKSQWVNYADSDCTRSLPIIRIQVDGDVCVDWFETTPDTINKVKQDDDIPLMVVTDGYTWAVTA